MAAIEAPTEAECCLWAVLQDESGIDLAEFALVDETQPDGCYRAWPVQVSWYRNESKRQIDEAARTLGKSMGIGLQAFVFPHIHPGEEMVITAPELIHLEPLTQTVERIFENSRLGKSLLPRGRSAVSHRPFAMNFTNGGRILGRIPQRDGKGFKGCLVGTDWILTDSGYKQIKDIGVGELVLTHKHRWKPVTNIVRDETLCYRVRGQGSFDLTVSWDHRFYGRRNLAKNPAKQKRNLDTQAWWGVGELVDNHVYWLTPTKFEELPIQELDPKGTALPLDIESDSFWWLAGLYLAEGFISKEKNKYRRIHWTAHPKNHPTILKHIETLDRSYKLKKRNHSSADIISVCSAAWARWAEEHLGSNSHNKKLPGWMLGLDENKRNAILEGYLYGDGSWDKRDRFLASSTSPALAMGVQMLAQSLGYKVNATLCHGEKIKSNFTDNPSDSWRIQILEEKGGHAIRSDGFLAAKIKAVEDVGVQEVFDIVVEEDHSYISNGIVSHNIHPIWLVTDEAQDLTSDAWVEIVETLNMGFEGARWKVHGVTRGFRDYFWQYTQPGSGWNVHRLTAQMRPTWSDEERKAKIQMYGSRDAPGFRRNVHGEHGDATTPIVSASRLAAVTDDDDESPYNTDEYFCIKLDSEALEKKSIPVTQALELPFGHLSKYKTFWVGCDLGWTVNPTEILICAEEIPSPEILRQRKKLKKGVPASGSSWLKLIGRIQLRRMPAPDQTDVMVKVISHYKPAAFSLDATGAGLPLVQFLQKDNPEILTYVKGYNFSEKVTVELDKLGILHSKEGEDELKANAQMWAIDSLRGLVDTKRIFFPWDIEVLKQISGGTIESGKRVLDEYGRKRISSGEDHALDALCMCILGWAQTPIEEFLDARRSKGPSPVLDLFVEL